MSKMLKRHKVCIERIRAGIKDYEPKLPSEQWFLDMLIHIALCEYDAKSKCAARKARRK